MGCICTSARAHPFFIPYKRLGGLLKSGVWLLARDPLGKSFTQVRDGMHLHVRTCTTLFHISRTVWRFGLKFSVLARNPFDQSYTSQMWVAPARAHVHTPFARWCLCGLSFIAHHGARLVCYFNKLHYMFCNMQF